MGKPIAVFGGRTWEELEVLEHEAGQLMFPAELRRRDTKGTVVKTKVRVRVPSPQDHFAARAQARKWAKTIELDPVADQDMFEQLEQLALLSRAIRTGDPPYGQFATAEELGAYDESSLRDIQEQISGFKAMLDPGDSLQTEEQVWRAIITVAREATIAPVLAFAGRDQPSLVVRMALEACRSPTAQSWLRSFGTSTPESSASTTTNES